MVFNYTFRSCGDEKDVLKVWNLLKKQPLNYPNYMDWAYRTKEELLAGYKEAIMAFSEGALVGELVFQPSKDYPRELLELKNMRIHPKLRGRFFGGFMLRQAEVEARKTYEGMLCDVRSDNLSVINLLKFLNYIELCRASIYENNVEDIVFHKNFKKENGIFVPLEKKILKNSF